ncbi:helix-turn-helix domain-containing protein [Streptomyces sp. P38-E01]|uniref:Helix-turn-helix domain-containing protein n=2 Tax=Streptomyces tardus TaxID=2780544 RepID=A0A949JBH6_9ACTN|nr:helix-turn-helix domain-containing protein [Streptomyces tardus]
MRALAHPVRMRLTGLLRQYGPSTATRLAERLSINSGAASYHLRQLAAHGYVEEDTERGNARERWWRALHEETHLDTSDLVEQDPAAVNAVLHSVVAGRTLHLQQMLNNYETLPRKWRKASDMSDWTLRLTPEEAVRLREELHEVVARYRQPPAGEGPPGEGLHRAEEHGETQRTEGPFEATATPVAATGAEHVSVAIQILPEPEQQEQPEQSEQPEQHRTEHATHPTHATHTERDESPARASRSESEAS